MNQTKQTHIRSKRTLALFLCLILVMLMLPLSAFAAGGALTHDRNGARYTYTIGYMYSGSQGGINTREIFTEPNNYAVWCCPVCGQGGGSSGTNLAENLYMPCYEYDVGATGGDTWIRYALVSWCADQCGYIETGVIPKYAGCVWGVQWFQERGQWADNSAEPTPGMIIFFDWDNKGSSGPQDGQSDHTGIVEKVENGRVYTVEGNSGDSCRENSYPVGYYEILGYGVPAY